MKQDLWTETLNVLKHTKEEVESEMKNEDFTVKLLCGGDLLESFAVPGLWNEQHVSCKKKWMKSEK